MSQIKTHNWLFFVVRFPICTKTFVILTSFPIPAINFKFKLLHVKFNELSIISVVSFWIFPWVFRYFALEFFEKIELMSWKYPGFSHKCPGELENIYWKVL